MSSSIFIVDLDSRDALSRDLVGGKAAKLAFLRQQGISVPSGFCITTRVFPALPEILGDKAFHEELVIYFENLMHRLNSHASLIVRSSANCEDSKDAAFPGIFESIKAVRTLKELHYAIRRCLSGATSSKVHSYCEERGINPNSIKMALLVQEEIKAKYSGAAISPYTTASGDRLKGIQVEMIRGPSQAMLKGGQVGSAYLITGTGHKPEIIQLNKSAQKKPMEELNILCRLFIVLNNASKFISDQEVIEWAVNDVGVYIIQSRPIPEPIGRGISQVSAVLSEQNHESIKLLAEAKQIGLKAAAMKFFEDLGWFTKTVVVVEPGTPYEALERNINSTPFGDKGLTVRFSFAREIGLPRFFATTKEEALDFIRKNRNSDWAVIVHDYIDVQASFEIFVDMNRVVLEHVPGIWESNTSLSPDVLIGETNKWEALRVFAPRMACIVSPQGEYRIEVEPINTKRIKYWARKLRIISMVIRSRLSESLPLICHCVSDNGDDWQFINIRKSSNVRQGSLDKRSFHIVSRLEDLRTWDGRTSILLRIQVDRGAEETLAKLAPHLPENNELIFIDFGVLSHPAIMLRELGVNPTPVYMTHERIDLTDSMEVII
jgi:hypothetical protein